MAERAHNQELLVRAILIVSIAILALPALAKKPEPGPAGLLVGGFALGPGRASDLCTIDVATGRLTVVRTTPKGNVFEGLLSPAGDRFVFPQEADRIELWLRARKGADERQLVEAMQGDVVLWSPEGRLLFVEGPGGAETAYLIDPDANVFWTWTVCGMGVNPRAIRWAADGTGLFFLGGERFYKAEHEHVRRCNFDGAVHHVTDLPGRAIDSVWISPDETKVVYDGNSRMLLVDIPDGAPRDAIAPARIDNHFSFWSPDSRWIGAQVQMKPSRTPQPYEMVIRNLETGRMKSFGFRSTLRVQWWAPRPLPTFDTREIVRAALGPGTPFTPPLKLKLRPLAVPR